jgi:hypothetical protein
MISAKTKEMDIKTATKEDKEYVSTDERQFGL